MFPKNFANLWKCAILGSFKWQTLLILQIKIASNSFFFSAKNYLQSSRYKRKLIVQSLLFSLLLLSSSSLFLFLLSFSFVSVILELIEPKKLAFWRLLTRLTTNFEKFVFKNSARLSCLSDAFSRARSFRARITKCLEVVEIRPWIKDWA